MAKIIIANWKMNPETEAEAMALARAADISGLIICPPFPFIKAVGATLKNALLGAQDVFWNGASGPYTGEVSAAELKGLNVRYVIIGHSERRLNLGETNEMIAKKVLAATAAEITPIVCIGERAEAKLLGTKEIILAEQLRKGLKELISSGRGIKNILLAYEPIWAISTSPNALPDKPEDTVTTISFIKKILAELDEQYQVKFLYGGSISARNAKNFLEQPEIDGALVGGASLKSEEIKKIVALAKAL